VRIAAPGDNQGLAVQTAANGTRSGNRGCLYRMLTGIDEASPLHAEGPIRMQQFPFRLARGVAVVIAILVAHFAIVWLFNNMRVRAPDLGPVYMMFFDNPPEEPKKQPPVGDGPNPASASASASETTDVAIGPPGEGPPEARQGP
jgi:hypothetical protein